MESSRGEQSKSSEGIPKLAPTRNEIKQSKATLIGFIPESSLLFLCFLVGLILLYLAAIDCGATILFGEGSIRLLFCRMGHSAQFSRRDLCSV